MIRYKKYKPSGVEWIGEIPDHWEIKKFKYLYKFSMGATILKVDLVENGDIPVFSATEDDSIFGYVNTANVILQKNDFVIPARGNSIGNIYLVEQKATSTQTTIYGKAINVVNQIPKFIFYYQKGLKEILFQFDNTAIPQITVDQVKNNDLLLPTLPEQMQIANFLDKKTAQIDDLIAKKEQLIKLLEEEKKAVINEAVTKGIDPNVKLKDSGIEWLGKIPEHWGLKRIGFISNVIDPQPDHRAPKIVENGYSYIGIRDINDDGSINHETTRKVSLEAVQKQERSFTIEKNDLVFCKVGTLGIPKFLILDQRVALSATLVLIKPIKIDNFFMFYSLNSNFIYNQIEKSATGSTRKALGIQEIRKFYLPFSTVEEQKEIVNYLRNEMNRINKIIYTTKKLIELLKEYRTALISEAVTGKIKVFDDEDL